MDGAVAEPRARRRRFIAPPRGSVPPQRFAHPVYADFDAHLDWMRADDWPAIATLDARLGAPAHPHSGVRLHLAAQTEELLADGLHYEQRILERGLVATRADNWHDLFNAMVWIRHLPLKAALNLRQAHDVARVGSAQRTRAQCALTHFDEAGAVVLLRDTSMLEAWDRHDWQRLFWQRREGWSDGGASLHVFGHALLEHALSGVLLPTAKCLVAVVDGDLRTDATGLSEVLLRRLATRIAAGELLQDPQELRPLPLAGLPGWDPRNATAKFLREVDCFRPLRAGRAYPPPARMATP